MYKNFTKSILPKARLQIGKINRNVGAYCCSTLDRSESEFESESEVEINIGKQEISDDESMFITQKSPKRKRAVDSSFKPPKRIK